MECEQNLRGRWREDGEAAICDLTVFILILPDQTLLLHTPSTCQ